MSALVYTLADAGEYAPPISGTGAEPPLRPAAVPAGWTGTPSGAWIGWAPGGSRFGGGGPRVWAAARPGRLQQVVDAFAEVCFAHGVPFRHVANRTVHARLDHPDGSWAQAGRACAACPADEAAAGELLRALHAATSRERGPAVPGARRHRDSGILHHGCATPSPAPPRPDGLPATEDDLIGGPPPAPAPPDGYTLRRLTAFSAAGYAYRARRTADGVEVLVEEAPAYAGPAGDGTTATDRLRDRWRALTRLHAEAPGLAPRPLDLLQGPGGDHLLTEPVDGVPLTSWVVAHSPLPRGGTPQEWERYHRRAERLSDAIGRDLRRLHALGHPVDGVGPGDVLVGGDDTVRLAGAAFAGSSRPPAPGQDAPDPVGPALARLTMALLTPLGTVAERDSAVLPHILRDLTARAPVPPALWRRATGPARPSADPAWPTPDQVDADPRGALGTLRDRLAAGLLDAASDDPLRVFPTVPQGYETNTVGVAHGTAGVVHALRAAGVPVPGWITERLRRDALAAAADLPPGLWTGLAGVARVLAGLGHLDEATALLGAADRHPLTAESATLAWGAAGVALAHLALYGHTGDERHVDRAQALTRFPSSGDALTARLGPNDATGLWYGRAGLAHAAQQLAAVTGEDRHRRDGLRLLHAELDRARESAPGELVFPVSAKDRRDMYYLACGTAGFLTTACRHQAAAPDERLAAALPKLVRKASMTYVAHAGLGQGLAGLGLALAECGRILGDGTARAASWASARALFQHAVPGDGAARVLGDMRLRPSCDLWSGSSGVLLFLAHLLDPAPDPLFSVDAVSRRPRGADAVSRRPPGAP